jgi:hypothetical protein
LLLPYLFEICFVFLQKIVTTKNVQLESEFYREVADAWSAAFAADRPHLLPYLDQFAANSGYFTFAGGDGGGNTVLPWRLMGLNSNLWYKSNSFTQGLEDPADQFRHAAQITPYSYAASGRV